MSSDRKGSFTDESHSDKSRTDVRDETNCRSIEKFPQKTAFVFILSTVATGLIRLFEAVGRDASPFNTI
jgi:hypothetical protein